MVEWSITTDCKSVAFGLRRFESFPAHMENIPHPFLPEKWTKLKERLALFASFLSHEKNLELHEKMLRKYIELKSKYPDAAKYQAYHALINSSAPEMPYDDFPGEDSVEAFIDNLILEG